MANLRLVVLEYAVQYSAPIRGAAGDVVSVIHGDDEYPEWVWCRAADGREGWVPIAFLERRGERGVLLRDYDATELAVRAGERLEAHEEIGGWTRATNGARQSGWVPSRCLTTD